MCFPLGRLPVMAFIYWREDGKVSLPGALLWAHIFTVIYYVWLATGCIAVGRLLSGKSSWTNSALTPGRTALG